MSDIESTFWQGVDTTEMIVLGISVGETDFTARRFATSFSLTFPILRDASEFVYYKYLVRGITPFPRDCIIDENGIVRYLHSEYDPYTMKKILNDIMITNISRGDDNPGIPQDLDFQIYPNPTNSHIKIEFNVRTTGMYRILIHDIAGRLIRDLQVPGEFTGSNKKLNINLDGNPSGIYLLTLQSAYQKKTKKLILVR